MLKLAGRPPTSRLATFLIMSESVIPYIPMTDNSSSSSAPFQISFYSTTGKSSFSRSAPSNTFAAFVTFSSSNTVHFTLCTASGFVTKNGTSTVYFGNGYDVETMTLSLSTSLSASLSISYGAGSSVKVCWSVAFFYQN